MKSREREAHIEDISKSHEEFLEYQPDAAFAWIDKSTAAPCHLVEEYLQGWRWHMKLGKPMPPGAATQAQTRGYKDAMASQFRETFYKESVRMHEEKS